MFVILKDPKERGTWRESNSEKEIAETSSPKPSMISLSNYPISAVHNEMNNNKNVKDFIFCWFGFYKLSKISREKIS